MRSVFLISRLITKLHCGIGDQHRLMEPRKKTHTNTPNLFFTKVQKQYNGQRVAFLTNGAGTIGHAKGKKKKEQP